MRGLSFLSLLTAGLIALSACSPTAAPPPSASISPEAPAAPSPAPPSTPLPLDAETLLDESGTRPKLNFSYRLPGREKEVFWGSIQGGGLDLLDPFWPEIQALLFPGGAAADLEMLASMAYDDYMAGWTGQTYLTLSDNRYQTMSSPYFFDTYAELQLVTASGTWTMLHTAHTSPDGTPMAFGDFFTVSEEEAARRCLDYILEHCSGQAMPHSPEELAAAFDPQRFYMGESGLLLWYPAGTLSSSRDLVSFLIPYPELGDILIPLTDRPLWVADGFDSYYLVAQDGSLICLDALSDYAEYTAIQHPQATLLGGRYFYNNKLANAYQSPVWSEIASFYDTLLDSVEADNARRAKALYAAWQRGSPQSSWAYEEMDIGASQIGTLLIYSQSLSVNHPDSEGCLYMRGCQAYDSGTGARMYLDDLFTRAEEARSRIAGHLAQVTGLSPAEAAKLIRQDGFGFGPDGKLLIFCSGYDLGDITLNLRAQTDPVPGPDGPSLSEYTTQWDPEQAPVLDDYFTGRVADFERLGVSLIPGAVYFPIPKELTDDLFRDFIPTNRFA